MLDPAQLLKEVEQTHVEDPEEQEYSNDEIVSHVIIEDFRPSDDESEDDMRQKMSRRKYQGDEDDEDEEMEDDDVEQEDDGFGKADDGWNNWQEAGRVGGNQMADEDRNVNIFGILATSKSSIPKRKIRPQDEFLATRNDTPEKKTAKRFTYETKAARRATTSKQKARRSEKAQIGRSNKGSKPAKKGGKR